MAFLTNITYKEIIEGKKILNICERKLEKFSFMDNKDFESPGLRKYLLVSNLAMNIINSEKGSVPKIYKYLLFFFFKKKKS
jgi:hypothetical protein